MKLNFMCGSKIVEGFDNCDIQKDKDIIFCDADKFPYPFKDNTYNYIYCRQALNLCLYPRRVLQEFWRISKNNAVIEIEVAHYHNKGAFNDLDTLHYFNEKTFYHFITGRCRVGKLNQFRMKIVLNRTWFGNLLLFGWVRKILNNFIGGIYSTMTIYLRVIK